MGNVKTNRDCPVGYETMFGVSIKLFEHALACPKNKLEEA